MSKGVNLAVLHQEKLHVVSHSLKTCSSKTQSAQ